MKVRGDNAPANAFSLEEQPDKPGYCLVRFYENVAPFSETQGELTISGFEYDEYYLELPFYDGIYDDILGSFDGYFAQAKLAEAEKETIPKLKQQVSDLQSAARPTRRRTRAMCSICSRRRSLRSVTSMSL